MRGDSGFSERSGEIYLPYLGHVSDSAVLLRDGSILAMGHIDGLAFELEDPSVRNVRVQNFNTLCRNIADDNVSINVHLVRHRGVSEHSGLSFRSEFARRLDRAYRLHALGSGFYKNDYFFSLLVSPRNSLGKMGGKMARLRNAEGQVTPVLHAVEDLWHVIEGALEEHGLRRLGVREKDGVMFSEIGEALHLIMTCHGSPVPLVSGSRGATLYTDRVICGKHGLQILAPDRTQLGSIFSFREYPAKTRPGMLNTLLSANFPLVLSQTFNFLTRAQAHARLAMKASQMISSGDKALTQIADLQQAEDALASNIFVMGSHHLSLAVYAETLKQLADRGAQARARLTDAGAVVVPEGIGLEAAYWSQLPGNFEWRTRPGAINSRNFAGFASFENFPMGKQTGHWGPSLTRFRTNGGTTYDYIPHVDDVGMTAIFGPIGRGKTTFLMFLLAMLEQPLAERGGAVVFFDKDRGGELLVRATGGTYLVLRRGEQSGLSPLRGLDDTPSSRDFLREWITGLIESDGRGAISPEEQKRLERGIARQLSYEAGMRSLAGLREFLFHGPSESAGARLERWCRGNALGWAFDGEVDEVRLDPAITGFDMTQLLDYEEVCAPAAAYILHRVRAVVDGRRFVMCCDEFRAYLLNPQFSNVVDKFLLTVRKNNGMLILATQQPEHVLESRLGASLVAQCMTKIIFPSPTADRTTYIDGLKCTEGEYKVIRDEMSIGKRKFLMKRDSGSVICEFDLANMQEYIAVLSGRANTVRFVDKLRCQFGDDPAHWLDEFMNRYAEEARD
jgi:type IV secretion system protein VirB4